MDVCKWLAETETLRAASSTASSDKQFIATDTAPTKIGKKGLQARDRRSTHVRASPSPGQGGRSHRNGKGKRVPTGDPKPRSASCSTPRKDTPSKTRENDGDDSGSLTSSAATDGSSEPPQPSAASHSSEGTVRQAPEPTYERRARRRTREDRYVLKNDKHGRRLQQKDGVGRRRKARKSAVRRGKTSEAIIHNFSASNVAQDRLTVGGFFEVILAFALASYLLLL